MSFRNLQIRGKLVASFGLAMAIVLSTLGLVTYLTFANALTVSSERIAALNVGAASAAVDSALAGYRAQVLGLSLALESPDTSMPQVAQPTAEALQPALRRLLRANPDVLSVALVGPSGGEWGRAGRAAGADEAWRQLPAFQGAASARSQQLHSIVDRAGQLWLAMPLAGQRAQANGPWVVLQMPAASLAAAAAKVALPERTTLMLHDHQRSLFIHTPDASALIDAAQLAQIMAVDASRPGLVKAGSHQVYATRIDSLGWDLRYAMPEAVFLADLIALKNRIIAATVFVLWVSVWIVLIIAHQIARPVRQLSQAIGDGHRMNFSQPIPVHPSGDEIGELSKAFEAMRARIQSLISVDALTGLFNRRHAMEALASATSSARRAQRPLSCLLMDVDFFKSVNDTLGHPCGDAVLASCAARFGEVVRAQDIVARYGGEEFLVILPDTAAGTAGTVAERIRQVIEQQWIDWQGQRLQVTLSIGLATLQAEMTDAALIASADQALYEAKRAGRNRVVQALGEGRFEPVSAVGRTAKPVAMSVGLPRAGGHADDGVQRAVPQQAREQGHEPKQADRQLGTTR